jgi:hypothetical protein
MSIVEDVRREGDDAVRRWALELDGVEPAPAVAEPDLLPREALLALAGRVRRWHEAQRPADIPLEVEPGVQLERRWVPLATVGIYVPRNLVSTLVMCAVPAQVAGVERIVVCTPPAGAGLVAAAAEALGIDEVWALGGPQAIAWLAYVRKVDKIVGPGNAYVNEAKLEVSRDVAIDLPGGPSEVVVVAVLALGSELQLDDARVGARVGDHDDLGRPARQVDRHVARDLELRVVHVLVAGPDDLVHPLDVREPADRLRPAERPDLLEAEHLGRGRDEPGALRRRADDDPPHARGLRRHGAHDEGRDEIARHVDADRVERHPAALERDARLHLE